MKILVVGAGGYGRIYLNSLFARKYPGLEIEGIVEKYFATCPLKDTIEQAGIPVYDTMEDFYREHTAELALIATPTFLHYEQSLCALQHGSYVLCEKPAAPTVEQVQLMMEAEKKYGKFIAIGFQWSYAPAIQALKKDILDGRLGKPLSLKTLICWPRNKGYYARGGGWGGRISKDGHLLLDSVASNACAHYLHNMFFLLGQTMNSSALPVKVEAECSRANDIENFDTCVLRMEMPGGCQAYFAATHACKTCSNPEFVYEFENARVEFSVDGEHEIIATFKDGTVKNYGDPNADETNKLRVCSECVKTGESPICTAETAIKHTMMINAIYKNVPIFNFPEELKGIRDENFVYVDGLFETIHKAYESKALLSETDPRLAKKYTFSF